MFRNKFFTGYWIPMVSKSEVLLSDFEWSKQNKCSVTEWLLNTNGLATVRYSNGLSMAWINFRGLLFYQTSMTTNSPWKLQNVETCLKRSKIVAFWKFLVLDWLEFNFEPFHARKTSISLQDDPVMVIKEHLQYQNGFWTPID